MDANYVITISGQSLSGKTTLGRLLQATGDFVEIVSHTTRPPRPNEYYGEDYYFVTEEVFAMMEYDGMMIGGTQVGEYRYGTAYEVLERAVKSDKVPFAVTDPEGPKFLKPWCEESGTTLVAIWRHVDRRRQLHRWLKRASENMEAPEDDIERLIGIVDREPIWYDEWDWDLILPQQTKEQAVETVNQVRLAVGLEPLPADWQIPQGIFKED